MARESHKAQCLELAAVPRRVRGGVTRPLEGVASSARGKGAGAACAHTVGGRAQDAQGRDGGGGSWKRGFPGGGGYRWGRSHSAAPSPDECARSSSLEAASGSSEGLGEGGPRRDSGGTGSHLHSGTRRGTVCGNHCKRCLLLCSTREAENSSEERFG